MPMPTPLAEPLPNDTPKELPLVMLVLMPAVLELARLAVLGFDVPAPLLNWLLLIVLPLIEVEPLKVVPFVPEPNWAPRLLLTVDELFCVVVELVPAICAEAASGMTAEQAIAIIANFDTFCIMYAPNENLLS
jgi:hypothetical protein